MSIARALEHEAVLVGAVLVGVYFLSTRAGQELVAKVTSAAVDAADNAAAGVVLGVGDSIGVPRTNRQLCQLAIDSDNWFEASKYCTVSELFAWQKSYIPPDP
jgi:hypothetical protein